MSEIYVERMLTVDENGTERTISEAGILSLSLPLVVLGDPGMGKTKLTESLAARLGVRRISAGSFSRAADLNALKPSGANSIIVDGLDELVASSGTSAVDDVLKKLSVMGHPPFILSCRAADWNGSADRHKIREDYGIEPVTVRLEPFSRGDATRVLSARGLDAKSLLDGLDRRDLGDFYKNPLTLTLVAEIVEDAQGLPEGRAELFDKASRILVREDNAIHQRDQGGMASPDDLLDSAGAIFAHLLLSGSLGIADRPPSVVPLGFIPIGDVTGVSDAALTIAVLKTRLFQSNEENLLVPYHRVVAEFLAGRWLAKRLDAGLSERRALQALTFAGGVPTALRGVYAWFGHFATRMTEACIRTDPYGALRYGDPERLSLPQARLLLQSLGALANEDPYFRSEDWGRRAVAGLARRELKSEILDLLKQPDRHLHLSTLVLESLAGSELTGEIVPELIQLLEDEHAIYIERHNAAEALVNAKVDVDWVALTRKLRAGGQGSGKRLALELTGQLDPSIFPSKDIAEALLDYHGVFREGREDDHVLGVEYTLLKRLSSSQSGEILDAVADQVAPLRRNRHWQIGHRMGWATFSLVTKALEANVAPAADRLWKWIRLTAGEQGLNDDERTKIAGYLRANNELRRNVQRLAFSDNDIDGAPWMAIAYDLPHINPALVLTPDDSAYFLDEIAVRDALSNFDIELWTALLRINGWHDGFPSLVEQAARRGIVRHPELQRHWDEITAPPKLDWRKEEEKRQRRANRERNQRFRKHREEFAPHGADIASGKAFGMLHSLANAYLDRYSDLHNKGGAVARLKEWLGDELAEAALSGFVAALHRTDLPTAKKIGETHAEGKAFNAEPVLVCGIAELVRTGEPLTGVPREILESALAAWWEYPDFNTQKLGDDLGKPLEAAVLTSDSEIAGFLTDVMEPRIRAGHEHVSGLYQLSRDERFRNVAGRLALTWLKAYPEAKTPVQHELIDSALRFAPRDEFCTLARERAVSAAPEQAALRSLWMGALFAVDFDRSEAVIRAFCQEDAAHLWALRSSIRSERSERWLPLSVRQLEFIVEMFAETWPPASHPVGGWTGDNNAWDATEFIRAAIESIGANKSKDASDALDRLVASSRASAYRDQIKHARAGQQRLRRNSDYHVPSFSETKAMLAGGLPGTIDDLKAFVRDAIDTVQAYLRRGDTMAWKAFWSGSTPCDENTCRDRLLDVLRGHLPKAISAIPETRMPDAKRADVGVIYNGLGLPIEVKGQWHKDVWEAVSSQLIDLYTKDYRADGHGIYLVLWFGPVAGKSLPPHPDKKALPKTPEQLHQMLIECLDPAERGRVDIVVLDVSPTSIQAK